MRIHCYYCYPRRLVVAGRSTSCRMIGLFREEVLERLEKPNNIPNDSTRYYPLYAGSRISVNDLLIIHVAVLNWKARTLLRSTPEDVRILEPSGVSDICWAYFQLTYRTFCFDDSIISQ